MTREGIKKCIKLITRAFPNYYKDFEEDGYLDLIEMWQVHFNGRKDLEVFIALNKVIATSSYPPAIADINRFLYEGFYRDYLSDEEAWQMVYERKMDCIFYSDPDEVDKRFASLPDYIRDIITPVFLDNLGKSSGDGIGYMKRDFLKLYHEKLDSIRNESIYNSIVHGVSEIGYQERELLE